MLICIITVQ